MKLAMGAVVVTMLPALLALPAGPARADSQPVLTGKVEGLETCAQASCGAATFIGTTQLQRATTQTKGAFLVQVTHGVPLPGPGASAPIIGGQWALTADGLIVTGIIPSGSLANNGNNTFAVTLTLQLLSGGAGSLNFHGILDHNTLPPTIVGIVSQ